MTAEVAILNKSAVALAADSKVSIGGTRPEKTYDTQNKIFTLSKVHPVGILVYNSADFMGFPWETIIKLYRSQKRDRSERTVADWADDFISYVKRFGPIRKIDIAENVVDVLFAILDEIEAVADAFAEKNSISKSTQDYNDLLKEILEGRLAAVRSRDVLFSSTRATAFLRQYGDELLSRSGTFRAFLRE